MSKRKKKVLVLRVNDKNGRAYYNRFQYPLKTRTWVEDPYWKPTKECGNGLHGFLYGEGSGGLAHWNSNDLWYVLSVDEDQIIILGEDKIKFKKGYIVFIGNRKDATDYIYSRTKNKKIIGGVRASFKIKENSYSGYRGISYSEEGNSISKSHGISITKIGKSTSEACGISITERGLAKSGDYGISIADDSGESNSGSYGISIVKESGSASSGRHGVSFGEYWAKVKSGIYGNLICKFYDKNIKTYRFATAFVDGVKIKSDTWYKVNDKGEFYEYNER